LCDLTNLKHICILYWILNSTYLSAWGLSVRLKHVAWIDGTNKICCAWWQHIRQTYFCSMPTAEGKIIVINWNVYPTLLICILKLLSHALIRTYTLRSGGQSGSGTGLSPTTSVLLCQYHFISAPHSLRCACCSCRKDKWAKPGNLPKRKSLWKIGEHWIGEYFHLVFKGLVELRDFGVGSVAYLAVYMDRSRFWSKWKQNAVERRCCTKHKYIVLH